MHAFPLVRRAVAGAVAVAALLAPVAAAAPAFAADPKPLSSGDGGPDGGRTAADDKLTDKVAETLEKQPVADFWVRFTDDPATTAALDAASKVGDWDDRGKAVYDALTHGAKAQRADVVAELDKEGVRHEEFWVTNSVLVHAGTKELATRLAAHAEVAEIRETSSFALDPGIKPKPAQAPKGAADAGSETTAEWGIAETKAPQVWATGVDGRGIVVANLDTGVDGEHEALQHSYRGYDAATDTYHNDYSWFDTDGACAGDAPCDRRGHGSHTMGTIVGSAPGHGIGMAPGATWIAANGCDSCSDADMIKAAQWLLAPTKTDGSAADPSKRPNVINNSWGSETPSTEPFMEDIIQAWDASGIFSVWAVGNEGPQCTTGGSPGSRTLTYAVGSYQQSGQISDFSSRGPGQDGETKPNLAAPGENIVSSWYDGSYATDSGTSMAAPHVTGAVALLWSAVPALVGDIEATRQLLDQTAIDTDDTTCGGTAADNSVWGEGKLDAAALVEAGIQAGGAGILRGTMTAADGTPVKGAKVTAAGTATRTATTKDDGTFQLPLLAGEYDVTVTAFGYRPHAEHVTVAVGGTVDATASLELAPHHAVAGTVVSDDDGDAVAGATVALDGTPVPTVTTGADGAFTLPDVPDGTYRLTVTPDGCLTPSTADLTVDGDETVPVTLKRYEDAGGYRCSTSAAAYRQGTEPLNLTGDDSTAQLDLPFDVPFYGSLYRSAWVTTNGLLSFEEAYGARWNEPIPSAQKPDVSIYPFWDDLVVDDASSMWTATSTVDGQDAFTVEWRNVRLYSGEGRFSFSVTLLRSGDVVVGYGPGTGSTPGASGDGATTGIEGSGDAGLQYSYDQPVLHDGLQVTYDLPEFGFVDVTVRDANDGQPLDGAAVTITQGDTSVASVVTGADGTATRQVRLGDYTVQVSQDRYRTARQDVHVGALFDHVAVDAPLATGVAALTADDGGSGTPGSLEWSGRAGDTRTGTLTVKNTGSTPLTYDLAEVGRDAAFPMTRSGDEADLSAWSTAASPGVSAKAAVATSAKGLDVAQALTPEQVGTTSYGDVLAHFPATGSGPWGLGFTGDRLWVGDYDSTTDTEHLLTGETTGARISAEWQPGTAAFDMAYDSRRNDVCQVIGGGDHAIHCFDPATGKETRTVSGDWSTVPLMGLAYDAGRDVYYVGSWFNGYIGTVAGPSHPDAGTLLSYCAPPERSIAGLAYNPVSDTIWYADSVGSYSRLWQIDPATCAPVKAVWFPGYRAYQGAGLEADASGALWAVDQTTSEVELVDVEDDTAADVPWLTLSATHGTIEPGQSAKVKVTVDADAAGAGRHGASVRVTSDTGRVSKQYVPVTFDVSAYDVGVDAGGKGYTDASGYRWDADQAWSDGSWGWTGGGKPAQTTLTTTRPVAGTDDATLLATARTSRGATLSYVFDDAPAGTYDVRLGFAELAGAAPGARVFDVLVDGKPVKYEYDAAAAVGALTADEVAVTVKHAAGDLTVELAGDKGTKAPAIGYLRVHDDPSATTTGAPPPLPVRAGDPAGAGVEPVVAAPDSGLPGRYAVAEGADGYRTGTDVLDLAGDDTSAEVTLPFAMPFYDAAVTDAWISTNGIVSFNGYWNGGYNSTLPDYNSPGETVFALWDDLVVDDPGQVRTATTTVDGKQAFVVEWHDVAFYGFGTRVSFSATLVEDGTIVLGYGPGIGGADPANGAHATVGLENPDGTVASLYSYDEPKLHEGLAVTFAPRAVGTLTGTVTDANDHGPLAGAQVHLYHDGSPFTFVAGKDGTWSGQVPPGKYDVVVSADQRASVSGEVTVTAGQEATFDAALTAGIASLQAGDLSWLVGPGGTATGTLTVTNTGTAPLAADLRTEARHAALPPLPQGSPSGVLGQFKPEYPDAWGVAQVGDRLWLSGWDDRKIREYTTGGTPTGRVFDTGLAAGFPADLAFDSTTGDVCAIYTGGDRALHCFDPATLKQTLTLRDPAWGNVAFQGLAYDPGEDVFYLGGWNAGRIGRIAGTTHETPGAVLGSCSPDHDQIAGLTFDSASGTLWQTDSVPTATSSLVRIDPVTCKTLETRTFPSSATVAGAGIELDSSGAMWVVDQMLGTVILADVGTTPAAGPTWLTVSQDHVSLAPGKSATVTVTASAADLKAGSYDASLLVAASSGRVRNQRVPVHLTASAYQVGVDAGGPGGTDAAGFTWSADQAYAAGSWGWTGKSKATTGKGDVAGTDDDALFLTSREATGQSFGYTFDDTPAGTYTVALGFAETGKATSRPEDVLVDGGVVLYQHDPVATAGAGTADVETVTVVHDGGPLTVELKGNKGDLSPALATLEVTQVPAG
ncbi:carboxypeptidase regulatory-like domain-containing protein [Xylanimonas sp. McL0601]|uniref:carboxypeptidase regulatory-like domain-containing protein n=1 Tax=Xylanimonas sp. McL0601 TaxID=3414739 RepID=UPI003CEDB408